MSKKLSKGNPFTWFVWISVKVIFFPFSFKTPLNQSCFPDFSVFCFGFLEPYLCSCSRNSKLAIFIYLLTNPLFTNPHFLQLQFHNFNLQLHKVSQIHAYFRPCIYQKIYFPEYFQNESKKWESLSLPMPPISILHSITGIFIA